MRVFHQVYQHRDYLPSEKDEPCGQFEANMRIIQKEVILIWHG